MLSLPRHTATNPTRKSIVHRHRAISLLSKVILATDLRQYEVPTFKGLELLLGCNESDSMDSERDLSSWNLCPICQDTITQPVKCVFKVRSALLPGVHCAAAPERAAQLPVVPQPSQKCPQVPAGRQPLRQAARGCSEGSQLYTSTVYTASCTPTGRAGAIARVCATSTDHCTDEAKAHQQRRCFGEATGCCSDDPEGVPIWCTANTRKGDRAGKHIECKGRRAEGSS